MAGIILATAYLIYFAVGLTNLRLPGLQYDEAADAVPALELIHGLPNSAFDTLDILGHKLPLVMGHYRRERHRARVDHIKVVTTSRVNLSLHSPAVRRLDKSS